MQGDSEMANRPGGCARAAGFLVIFSFLAGAAGAQRLWSVGEVPGAGYESVLFTVHWEGPPLGSSNWRTT